MAAFASITKQKAKLNDFATKGTFASAITTALASNGAGSPTYGGYFTMDAADEKVLIVIRNAAAASGSDNVNDNQTATIKAGNGIQGVSDLTVSDLDHGDYTFLCIESGRFKNVAENATLKALSSSTASDQVSAKGKVFITGSSTNISVGVFVLS